MNLFVSLFLVVSPLAAADIRFDLVDTGMEKEIKPGAEQEGCNECPDIPTCVKGAIDEAITEDKKRNCDRNKGQQEPDYVFPMVRVWHEKDLQVKAGYDQCPKVTKK